MSSYQEFQNFCAPVPHVFAHFCHFECGNPAFDLPLYIFCICLWRDGKLMPCHFSHWSLDSKESHLDIWRNYVTLPEVLWCLGYSPFAHSGFTFHPSSSCCVAKTDFYGFIIWFSCLLPATCVQPMECTDQKLEGLSWERDISGFILLYVSLCWTELCFCFCFSFSFSIWK